MLTLNAAEGSATITTNRPKQMNAFRAQTLDELVELFITAGKKGIAVNRYKGLGEMNADQLWETTMNPETRTLLRVDSDNAALADEIFTMLMGEKVGPRKDFIKTEARKVKNLDI